MSAPSPASLHRTLATLLNLVREARLPHMIVGAFAVAVWGRPRGTLDLDLVLLTDAGGLRNLAAAAARRGFTPDDEWAERNPMIRNSHLRLVRNDVAVDLMLPRDPHDERALRRRRRRRWGRRFVWVAAPEDLILQKLKVGRPRDFEDALAVTIACPVPLDRRYLTRWANRLGIRGELEYLLGMVLPDRSERWSR